MQWARYSLFIVLCLVLLLYAKFFPINLYPFGFTAPQTLDLLIPIIHHKLSSWEPHSLKVLNAYLLGVPLKGFQELKSAHEGLNLSHLLSPSAFHLISINWVFQKILPKSLHFLLYLLIIIVGYYFLPLHPAFLRSLTLYSGLLLITSHKSKDIYLVVFLFFDFIWGSYQLQPMSYIFSFIILGHLMLLPQKMRMISKLFLAQLFLSLLFPIKIHLLNFLIGFNLGILFLPILTSIIIYLILIPGNWIMLSEFLEYIFVLFLLTTQRINHFLVEYMAFTNTDNYLTILFFILLKWHGKIFPVPLIILTILWC